MVFNFVRRRTVWKPKTSSSYRGESEKSFEWPERAYEQRDAGMTEMTADSTFKNLRRDQRYAELLAKICLATSRASKNHSGNSVC